MRPPSRPTTARYSTARRSTARRSTARHTAAALAAVATVALALLARPDARFGEVLWGPEHPWAHRDFLGAWWLFWARAQPEGIDGWLARQNHPDGALPLPFHVPNPWDALLLGPLVAEAVEGGQDPPTRRR